MTKETKAPSRSWLISYRERDGGYGTKHEYDRMKVIDEHPTLWVARQNSYNGYDLKICRVYSAIEIPPDDVQTVKDDLSGKRDDGPW
jgi:hypothetical protein